MMKTKQETHVARPQGMPMSDQQRLDAVAEIIAAIASRRVRKEQANQNTSSDN